MAPNLPPFIEPAAQPRPYFLINQLQLAMVGGLEKRLQPVGLTPAIGRVLNAIATRPKISSSSLAKMLGITPQSIKQSIIALEQAGLIERNVAAHDQRVMAAQLTEKGWRVREQQVQAINEMYREVFPTFSKREMSSLIRLLTKAVTTARPHAMEYFSADVTAGGGKQPSSG